MRRRIVRAPLVLAIALACGGAGEEPIVVAAARAPRVLALEIADTRGCLIDGADGFNRVYCWSGGEARVARRVPALEPASAISVSDRSICSVRSGVQVVCLNDLEAPNRVRSIEMGVGLFTALTRDDCALRLDGRVHCRRRRDVESLEDVIDIGGDAHHACYLQRDGALSCVVNGRLKPRGSFPGAVAYRADCLLYGDGSVSCPAGRMGYTGGLRRELAPVELPGPAVAIAASASHGCALLDTGELVCQGSNAWGQLGDGRTGGGPELTRIDRCRSRAAPPAGPGTAHRQSYCRMEQSS